MMRRKTIQFWLVFAAVLLLLGTGAVAIWKWMDGKMKCLVLELPSGYVYETGIGETLKKQKEEGISIALWKEEKEVFIVNPEFNRSLRMDALAFAGESSVLFPYGNALVSGEEGYCILGENVARQLFGSTKVSGKTVQIKGKDYQVAGIEFDRPDIFVYQLSGDSKEMLEYAGITYRSQSEKYKKLRCLQNYFGVSE